MPLPTAAELTDQTVTNTQMKDLLGQLVKNIDRSYSSLTEANADIANIEVGVTVTVNAENGGKYYKATADATSLTKSAYDPLTQAKLDATTKANNAETNAKTYVNNNSVKRDYLELLKNKVAITKSKKDIVGLFSAKENKDLEVESTQTLNELSTFSISKNAVLNLNATVQGNSLVSDLNLVDAVTNKLISSIELYPTDVLNKGTISRYYRDFDNTAAKITSVVIVEKTSNFRRLRANISASYQGGELIQFPTFVETTRTFASLSQQELSSSLVDAISGHSSSNSIQFWVSNETLLKAGYNDTDTDAIEYVKSIYPVLNLQLRSSTPIFIKNELFKDVNLGLGNYSFATGSLLSSVSVVIDTLTDGEVIKTQLKSAYSVLSTTATNALSSDYSGWVELKVEFERGVVFSNNQLVVIDNDENEYACQFAPELHQNLRKLKTEGYYSDGSFKSGSLYIYDSLTANETKSYVLQIYEDSVVEDDTLFEESSDSTKHFVEYAGYTLSFSKIGYPYPFNGITYNNVYHHFGLRNVQYVATKADPTMVYSLDLVVLKDAKITNLGQNFIDVEVVCANPLDSRFSLNAGAIEAYNFVRLFNDGTVKVKTIYRATEEISAKILYGVYSGLGSLGQTLTQESYEFNISYRYLKRIIDASNSNAVYFDSFYGDIHRDGIEYGPIRPVHFYSNVTATFFDIRGGWRDSVGSASSLNWNITKHWAWVTNLTIVINPTITEAIDLISHFYNEPKGLLSGQSHVFRKKNRLLNNAKEYALDLLDLYYSDFNLKPTGNNVWRAYSAELLNLIVNNVGTFANIADSFIAAVKNRAGVTDLTQVGSAFTSGNFNRFAMQFDSRFISPHSLFLYKYAIQINDTTRANQLKQIIVSYAQAMANHVNTYGALNMNGSLTYNGASNMAASGMRFIAQGIYVGGDKDGSMLTAFNTMNAYFDTTAAKTWMPMQNYITDGQNELISNSRYLHYVMYTINQYAQCCLLLNIAPKFDLAQYALNAYNANGQPREIEWCVSESRRGGRDTQSFALSGLTYYDRDGSFNLAERILKNIKDDFDIKTDGYYAREYGYISTTSSGSDNKATTGIHFVLASLLDVWFNSYFKIR